MAKATEKTTAPAEEFKLPFEVGTVDEIPATSRTVGARGEPNPIRLTMEWMGDQEFKADSKPLSFFVPIETVDANITDANEREKAAKDAARKLGNKIGGIARSINTARDKAGHGKLAFEQRVRQEVVKDRGDAPVQGVRVYLAAPTASEDEAA